MKQLRQPAIEAGARVIGIGGSKIGTVQRPIYDAESGDLTAITVRCGLLGRTCKLVPAEHIKQVNPGGGTVVVRLDKKDLRTMLTAEAGSGDHDIQVRLPRPDSRMAGSRTERALDE